MKRWILLVGWIGCVACGEPDPLVESARDWIGVYRIDNFQVDEEGCTPDGEQREPPFQHVQLDVQFHDTLHQVNIRGCVSTDDCVGIPWFQLAVEDFPPRELQGVWGDYRYAGASGGGTCSYWWTKGHLTRTGDDLRAEMRSRDVKDVPVDSEAACEARLLALEEDEGCDAFQVLEGTRVR